jgi:glycosyltransferase involved in cell wall biosynthesis
MKVSILTPINLDKSVLHTRCIESIANQTSKDFEWVLIFDGRTIIPESDLAILDRVNAKWAMTGGNYGPSVARNIGFQISDGDIITYLDSDDELSPVRVETLLSIFEKNPMTKLCFSPYMISPENYTVNHQMYKDGLGYKTDYEYARELLKTQNISIPMGVAHTRDVFALEFGFQRGIVCGEDGILWRRIVDDLFPEGVILAGSVAGTYHVNPNGQSRTQRRFQMGGFAFDGSKHDNGKYLDKDWYATVSSVNLFDKE